MTNELIECWREAFKKIAPTRIHHIADQFTLTHILLIYLLILFGATVILHLYFYFRS